jgi:hypothetical protein
MPLHRIPRRSLVALACGALASIGACSKADNTNAGAGATNVAAAPDTTAYRPLCPEDGRWNQCVLLDKLVHAGLAPVADSTDTTHVKFFATPGIRYHIGKSGMLTAFYFADSVAAKKKWAELDTFRLVPKDDKMAADSLLPWGKRPASIRAGNLLAAFTSENPAQIERVIAVFAAGLPAPPAMEKLPRP